MNMTEELKGKPALVTGASRGIGRATALALARQGASLVVHFNSAVASARELVTAIRAEGGDAEAVRADLSTHAGTASLPRMSLPSVNASSTFWWQMPALQRQALSQTIRKPILIDCLRPTSKACSSLSRNFCQRLRRLQV